MKVDGKPYRTVWSEPVEGCPGEAVWIIDQRTLPFAFDLEHLADTESVATAIRDMHVRGAGCIGATAGYGMYLAVREAIAEAELEPEFATGFAPSLRRKAERLLATRPTAVNLRWAVERQCTAVARALESGSGLDAAAAAERVALETAKAIADEDAAWCASIGEHGRALIECLYAEKEETEPVNILTHCNAGWLAFVDHGSATAPIYAAHDAGIPVHVWIDETRPRNQGARLTAWELASHGVPHTVIVDNAGGHLMQRGLVDLVLTGSDRTTRCGDVANKIGTYLKALAARDNGIPFYVALPSSTIDWEICDGLEEIPIEQRDGDEVALISGPAVAPGTAASSGELAVRVVPEVSRVRNDAFDVTPSSLVSGLITERGICDASEEDILELFPERFSPEREEAQRCAEVQPSDPFADDGVRLAEEILAQER